MATFSKTSVSFPLADSAETLSNTVSNSVSAFSGILDAYYTAAELSRSTLATDPTTVGFDAESLLKSVLDTFADLDKVGVHLLQYLPRTVDGVRRWSQIKSGVACSLDQHLPSSTYPVSVLGFFISTSAADTLLTDVATLRTLTQLAEPLFTFQDEPESYSLGCVAEVSVDSVLLGEAIPALGQVASAFRNAGDALQAGTKLDDMTRDMVTALNDRGDLLDTIAASLDSATANLPVLSGLDIFRFEGTSLSSSVDVTDALGTSGGPEDNDYVAGVLLVVDSADFASLTAVL